MKAIQTYFWASALLIVALIGCEKEKKDRSCEEGVVPCVVDSSKVNIRIRNFTGYPICDLRMDYSRDDSLIWGAIGRGDSTCFVAVDSSIDSPFIQYNVGTEGVIASFGQFGSNYYRDAKTFITYDLYADQYIDTAQSDLPDYIHYSFLLRPIADVVVYP